MRDEELDWRRDVEIDKSRLDWEWTRQPGLFMRYVEAAVRARREADVAKETFERVKTEAKATIEATEARVADKLRTTPDPGTGKFPSESAITRMLPMQKEVIRVREEQAELTSEAHQDSIDAWERVGFLQGAKDAIGDQKKTSMEMLVRLLSMDYWSAPRVTGEEAEAAVHNLERQATAERATKVTRRRHRTVPVED